jgi:hypothetical protein
MEDTTLESYRNNAALRREMKAAAKRERARVLRRFLEQAAQALLGDRSAAERTDLVQRTSALRSVLRKTGP